MGDVVAGLFRGIGMGQAAGAAVYDRENRVVVTPRQQRWRARHNELGFQYK
jgi:hypothetical protein